MQGGWEAILSGEAAQSRRRLMDATTLALRSEKPETGDFQILMAIHFLDISAFCVAPVNFIQLIHLSM